MIRFDVFEADLSTGYLTKQGQRVSLQDLPFRLLVALLERSGEIVTREQLRERLWGGTIVDFDDGLHTAMRKLRDALGDSAAHPRFIETVPRQGYRFLAPISVTAKTDRENPLEVRAAETESIRAPQVAAGGRIAPRYTWMVIGAGVFAIGLFVVLYNKDSRGPRPSADVVPITSYRGVQRSPSLSPDGTRFAFTWDGGIDKNLDLYIQNIDGSRRIKLTSDPAPDLYPAWSPDGRTIAFTMNGELYVIPAIGGAEHKITTAAGRGLSWSADSQTLAFSDRESPDGPLSIFLISVNSKERHRLTTPAASKEADSWPSFSPDARDIAFVRATTTTTDIYRVNTSGDVPTRVAIVGHPLGGLAWTPDSKYLLVATGRQPPGLLAIPASARDSENLDRVDVAGADVYDPSIIARGRGPEMDLAFGHETSNWDVWGTAIGHSQASPAPLVASSRADQAPSFSPDGLWIAFNSARSGYEEIWVSMADGTQARQLTHFNSGLASSPRWSTDGQWIAFDATIKDNRDIYVIRADGGLPVRMTRETSAEARPSWSRDGQWLYFMSDRSGSQQIWKMPTAGGRPSQITKRGGFEAFESTDGQSVYYTKEQRGQGIWRVPVTGGPEGLVSNLPWQNFWSLGPSGIYFFDLTGLVPQVFETPRDIPLKRIDPTTNRVETVATVLTDLPDAIPALDVRRDGKYFAWVGRREHHSELMLVRNLQLGPK